MDNCNIQIGKQLRKKVRAGELEDDPEKSAKYQAYLDEELAKCKETGYVAAVIVDDMHGQINCSNRSISAGLILRICNQTIGATGPRANGRISHRHLCRIVSCRNPGYFVRGEYFGLDADKHKGQPWIKLVNLKADPEFSPISTFCKPRRSG